MQSFEESSNRKIWLDPFPPMSHINEPRAAQRVYTFSNKKWTVGKQLEFATGTFYPFLLLAWATSIAFWRDKIVEIIAVFLNVSRRLNPRRISLTFPFALECDSFFRYMLYGNKTSFMRSYDEIC